MKHLLKKFRRRSIEFPVEVWEAIQAEADYHKISFDWCLNEILREQIEIEEEKEKAACAE